MSKMSKAKLQCPDCDNEQLAEFWKSINVDLDPELKDRLFRGEINHIKCKQCDNEAFINIPLLYHDMTKQFMVQYYPSGMLDDCSNFEDFNAQGKLQINLGGLMNGLKKGTGAYLEEPHVVFSMNEMVLYIIFRELLFERDHE